MIFEMIAVPMRKERKQNMHDPARPGEFIRAVCLTPLSLTVTAAADALGVTRQALSDLLNGHSGVSPDMAIRLERVSGGKAASWLWMRMKLDLSLAWKRAGMIKVSKRYILRVPAA